jgi:hypothetical protein
LRGNDEQEVVFGLECEKRIKSPSKFFQRTPKSFKTIYPILSPFASYLCTGSNSFLAESGEKGGIPDSFLLPKKVFDGCGFSVDKGLGFTHNTPNKMQSCGILFEATG